MGFTVLMVGFSLLRGYPPEVPGTIPPWLGSITKLGMKTGERGVLDLKLSSPT